MLPRGGPIVTEAGKCRGDGRPAHQGTPANRLRYADGLGPVSRRSPEPTGTLTVGDRHEEIRDHVDATTGHALT